MEKIREYYKKKFDDLMQHTCNFIPQKGEIFKQCDGIEEPAYWFISNYGRLFSVYYKKQPLIQLTIHYARTGINRKQHDWWYTTKWDDKVRQPRLHKLVAKYFLENEFDGYAEVEGEPLEVHHIMPESTFSKDEPLVANRVDNLQILPKSVHNFITHIDSVEKKMEKMKGQDQIIIGQISTQTLIADIQKHIENWNLAYIVQQDDKKVSARPLKKVEE